MALRNLICEKLHFTNNQPTFSNLPGFLDEAFSDVTVTISHHDFEAMTYKLHRNVLAGCSSVMHEALVDVNRNAKETTLDIKYISPHEFELLIIFMYTGVMCLKSVRELCFGMYAANLYKLDGLIAKCSDRLMEKLDEDSSNALLILELDERFQLRSDNATLFEMIDETIKKNYRDIISSDLIKNVGQNTLKSLLQMETTADVPEIEVFRALIKWSNACCSKSGIHRGPKQLQDMAGDLIYQVRYTLMPIEIIGTEVGPSGLLPQNLIALIFLKFYNDDVDVPFRVDSRVRVKDNESSITFDKEEWDLVSTCSNEEHKTKQLDKWTTIVTLTWDKNVGPSDWISIPAAAGTSTRWEVQLWYEDTGDLDVTLRCQSLDKQYDGVSVRLFAAVEEYPEIWTEIAAYLSLGKESTSRFSDIMHQHHTGSIKVRVQWTELHRQLPLSRKLCEDGTVFIRCRWKLFGWKTVSPKSNNCPWRLFSEPFGRGGALWRMLVDYYDNGCSNDRKLAVWVQLEHLPATLSNLLLPINCSMALWDRCLEKPEANMNRNTYCGWIVLESVRLESRDPIDLSVSIHLKEKN